MYLKNMWVEEEFIFIRLVSEFNENVKMLLKLNIGLNWKIIFHNWWHVVFVK